MGFRRGLHPYLAPIASEVDVRPLQCGVLDAQGSTQPRLRAAPVTLWVDHRTQGSINPQLGSCSEAIHETNGLGWDARSGHYRAGVVQEAGVGELDGGEARVGAHSPAAGVGAVPSEGHCLELEGAGVSEGVDRTSGFL